jgi:hypothetical protein
LNIGGNPMPISLARAVAVIAACLAGPLLAWPAAAQSDVTWHATIAPTQVEAGTQRFAVSVTGGGEWRSGSTGLGGDVSVVYLPAASETTPTYHVFAPADALLVPSGFIVYHFARAGDAHTVEPYLKGGIAAIAGGFLFDTAGGVDWWLWQRAGLRLGVRDRFLTVAHPFVFIGFEAGLIVR